MAFKELIRLLEPKEILNTEFQNIVLQSEVCIWHLYSFGTHFSLCLSALHLPDSQGPDHTLNAQLPTALFTVTSINTFYSKGNSIHIHQRLMSEMLTHLSFQKGLLHHYTHLHQQRTKALSQSVTGNSLVLFNKSQVTLLQTFIWSYDIILIMITASH